MQAGQGLVLDPADIYPSARDVRAAIRAGDWGRAVWIMNQTDPSERTALALVAADAEGGPLARQVLEAHPDDPLAAAVVAYALVLEGWEVRGSGRASSVSADSFQTFHEILGRADQVLFDAIAHQENDPTLWAISLVPARALGLGPSEALYRYQRVERIAPNLVFAQSDYLQFLCPKWYGSWEQADAFAEACARQSPPGSLNAAAVPMVHIERGTDSIDELLRHLGQSSVGAAIWQAAQHSVWHPQFTPRYGWVRALHVFACAFALLGDQRNAVALLDRTGPYASDSPWYYFGDPVEVIAKVRAGKPLVTKKGRR